MSARVAEFYDRTVEHETQRLGETPYRRLERDMTLRAIRHHLPAPSRVLDVGGGPGAYIEPLTALGHDVSLCDLSIENVRVAQVRLREQSLSVDRARVANAIDLSAYADASFDAALAAGPFYHLVDPEEQRRALAELRRVVRPGGLLFLAILPRNNAARYFLREATETSFAAFERTNWGQLLATGQYANPFGDAAEDLYFTDAHLWDVREFRAFLSSGDCRVRDAIALEGFCAWRDAELERWLAGMPSDEARERAFEKILNLVETTSRREDELGAAEHVLFIAAV
jgi:ubiquinone/menaquinone biosynthesis C-methylase UbiE